MVERTELTARIDAVMPDTVRDLVELVRITSISSLDDQRQAVTASAERVAELLVRAHCPDVQIVDEGGMPAVIGRFPAPAGMPTVCVYAHHDVQPTGDLAGWSSEPFVATERDGRLYGRGTADDKGGSAAHLAAMRAFGGKPPVGVTFFIEGEEEIGSPSLATILERHADLLAADVFIIMDSVNWTQGTPAFTTTLRGLADCVVEVSTLDHPLHSGQFGGLVPDALMALTRLLATLHHEDGSVAVEGLGGRAAEPLDYPEDRLRAETGLLEGVEFIGAGTPVDRMWTQPSISVLAIDAPRVAEASNTLQASARAKVSLRVPPGTAASEALDALTRHLESHAPWGARVRVLDGDTGDAGEIPFEGEICEVARGAWRDGFGVEPTFIGCGGSIPMVADFQRAFPDATVLVTAVTDPDSRMHGFDESLSLADLRAAALSEVFFLNDLAGVRR